MSSNLGETAKKLILVCWEKAQKQCTQEQSRPQQHTWNSKLLFFPLKITAAQSLHFQHLMWTVVISSRRL